MRGEVAVAEAEPRLGAEVAHGLEAAEGLAREAPAPLDIEPAGERVGDRVEVGRDVESPDLGVVAGVADDGQVARVHDGRQASEELGGAGATGDRGDVHG